MKIILLTGLPGSGKTTYAKKLEEDGAYRCTLDEEVFKRFDRYSTKELDIREEIVREEIIEKILEGKTKNQLVVLDWGLWKDNYRQKLIGLFQRAGLEVELVYFTADFDILIKRVSDRDQNSNHYISATMMKKFATEYEVPKNYDKIIIT